MPVSAFELIFKIAEDYYLGGTIRALHDKVELFFHYPWGSRIGAQIRQVGSDAEAVGASLDHISFHNDGAVHGKGRDSRKRLKHYNRLEAGSNMFNLERGHFLPIYLQSVSVEHGQNRGGKLRRIEATPRQREEYWDVTNLRFFSVIMVSKCATINPGRLLACHGFQGLTVVGEPRILANIFTATEKAVLLGGCRSGFDTQLLVLVVEETWNEAPPQGLPQHAIGLVSVDVCLPPMALIGKMNNHNRMC